jgi:hypothetical protein
MRSTSTAILILLTLAVGACGPRYALDGKTFESKEAALDYSRDLLDKKMVAPVRPLPSPVGGSVLIIQPPQTYLESMIRADDPYADAALIDLTAKISASFFEAFAEMIERRNLFESVSVTLASTPAGIDAPADGYLIWQEVRNTSDMYTHIIAAGESETTNVRDLINPADIPKHEDLEDRPDLFMDAIEEFVITHRPSA